MAQLNVRIPDEMKVKLEKRAESCRRSVAFIVRDAIEAYFNQLEDIDRPEEKEN